MEFWRFLNEVTLVPALILARGRRLISRLPTVNRWMEFLLAGTRRLKRRCFTQAAPLNELPGISKFRGTAVSVRNAKEASRRSEAAECASLGTRLLGLAVRVRLGELNVVKRIESFGRSG